MSTWVPPLSLSQSAAVAVAAVDPASSAAAAHVRNGGEAASAPWASIAALD